jgi:chromate transporter
LKDDPGTLLALVAVFVPLSLASIGGGPAVLSEMQHQAVLVHGWMTEREFGDLFAISRAAPGPGALLATLVGWKAAGWPGALVASVAFFAPPCLLVYGALHLSRRAHGSPWRRGIEAGLAPIGIGLMCAGSYAVLKPDDTGPLGWTLAAAVAAGRLWRPGLSPLAWLGLGAGLGALAGG